MRPHAYMVSNVAASRRRFSWLYFGIVLWTATAFVVAGAVTNAPSIAAQERTRTGVATETIDIWRQRDSDSEVLLTVPAGAQLTVTGRARKGYYPVTVAGVSGWTLTGSVAISVGTSTARATRERKQQSLRGFTTDNLNLRAGPGTKNRVRKVIPAGDDLELTGQERGGFVAVRHGDETGWVAEEFVIAAESAAASVPEPERAVAAAPQPVLRGDPREMPPDDIIPFIYAAADYYGQPREDMLRVARCESDLVPMAVNAEGGSYGIFQFKTGTWLSTPYAEYDIFDPRASAYAAGWMWSVGRRNEWVCQ